MTREWITCGSCGNPMSWDGAGTQPDTCAVCKWLGPRALVPLLADPSPERIAAFRASPPGWLRAQRETGNPVLPRRYAVREDPNHMP